MANARNLAGSLPGFFRISDLKDADVILTISRASVRAIGADQDEKPVLDFVESPKSLVLNATRASQLEGLFGDKELEGQKVKLGVRAISVRGRQMEMIAILSAAD